MITQFMAGLRTDDEVRQFVNNASRPDDIAVIEFGASWCHHCHQVFPEYYAMSRQVGHFTHSFDESPVHELCAVSEATLCRCTHRCSESGRKGEGTKRRKALRSCACMYSICRRRRHLHSIAMVAGSTKSVEPICKHSKIACGYTKTNTQTTSQ